MSSSRLTVHASWSDNSDYSAPEQSQSIEIESTSDTLRKDLEGLSVATGGTTVTTSEFATITRLVVSNKDSTNYITVTGDSNSGAFSLQVVTGDSIVLGTVDVGTNLTLTANSSACLCDVTIWGTA